MAAQSPLQRFYEQQLRRALSGDEKPKAPSIARRGAETYLSGGNQSVFSGEVGEAISRANKAEKKAGFLGAAKRAGTSLLDVAAKTISVPGEIGRGLVFGGTNAVLGAIDKDLVLDINNDGVSDRGLFSRDQLGSLLAAFDPNERVVGFGDMDPLKVNPNDGTATRFAKYLGAFAGDAALDPLTYVTMGTGAVGRTGAAKLAGAVVAEAGEQAAKTVATGVAREALEAAGDDVITKLAKEGIKKKTRTTAAALANGADDAATEALSQVGRSDIIDIAAEELSTRAQAAFRRGGNTAFRRELQQQLGDEVGLNLFRQAPAPVRGGIRIGGRELLPGRGFGGGQALERLGAPGDALINTLEATVRARNAVGSRIPLGGRASELNRTAKAAAGAAAKDSAQIADQLVAERAIREQALAEVEKNATVQEIRKSTTQGVQRYDALAEKYGPEAFGRAVFEAYDSPDFERFAASRLASAGVTDLQRDAIEMARVIRDIPGALYERFQNDLGDVFSEAEALTGSARRVETRAERAGRAQLQEARTGTPRGTRENLKRREDYWSDAEQRWLTVREINEQVGRQKFEEDPRRIFLETMERLERGAGDGVVRRRLLESGVIVAPPEDMTMSGERLAKIGKGFQDKARTKADNVRALAERVGTVEPTPIQARALAQGADITEGRLEDLMAEAQQLAAMREEAVLGREAAREELTSSQGVARLTERRNTLINDVRLVERDINVEADRIAPEIDQLQARSAELSAELADQQAYWAERGGRKIPKSSQAWLDATEQQIKDIELAMEAATDPIVQLKQQRARLLARIDQTVEELANARKERSADLKKLRRDNEKLGRQADSAQRRLEQAQKRKAAADSAADRLARRQEAATTRAAKILEANAPVFATQERINALMARVATEPIGPQDSLYQELRDFVISQSETTIKAMEERLQSLVEDGAEDAWSIASREQYLEKSRQALQRVRTTTDPDLSVMGSFLQNQDFIRIGTKVGDDEVARVAGALRGYFVDESVSRALTVMYRVQDPKEASKLFSHFYDPFEKLWRTYATVGRGPGFVVRNVLGGAYNAIVGGTGLQGFMLGYRYTEAVVRAQRGVVRALTQDPIPANQIGAFADNLLKAELDKLPAVGGRSMWELHTEMNKRGMFAGLTTAALGQDTADAAAVLGRQRRNVIPAVDRETLGEASSATRAAVRLVDVAANNPWINTVSAWSSTSEMYLRSSTFLGAVAQGGRGGAELTYADVLVKATQFDYGDLSDFERKIVRFVAPFYVWTRNNVPLQIRSLINRPGVPAAVIRGQEQAEENFGGTGEWADTVERFLPDYVENALGFSGAGETPLLYGIGAPLADLGRIATGLENVDSAADLATLPLNVIAGLGDESVAQLNPFIKAGVEGVTGESLFTGAEYGKEPVTGALAGLVPGGTVDPETGQREASGFAMAQARNLFPLLGLVQRAVPSGANPILGNPNYDDRMLTSWVSSIAGLGGLPFAAPMGTATEAQLRGQASRAARENNSNFDKAAAAQGLDPERLAKVIARGAPQEEVQSLIDSGWLLAPYLRAELGLP